MSILHNWQDLFAMSAGLIFCLSTLPTIWNQWKIKASTIPLSTSVAMVFAIALLCPVYFSFGLWVGLGTLVTQLSLWTIISLQRLAYGDGQTTQEDYDASYFEFQSANQEERAKM